MTGFIAFLLLMSILFGIGMGVAGLFERKEP